MQMHELFASNNDPKVALSDWMPLPEVEAIEVSYFYATEVDSGSVGLRALAQMSKDGGWSHSGPGDDVAIHAGYVDLDNDTWHEHQARLGLDPELNGFTHVRLAVQCRTNLSGTKLGDDRIIPFRAAVQWTVKRRPVQRIPIEQRLIANDSATVGNAQNWRLTGPVATLGMNAFRVRAVLQIIEAFEEAGTFTIRPTFMTTDTPLDPTSWSNITDVDSVSWTARNELLVSDYAVVGDFDNAAIAFGLKVWGGSDVHAGFVAGHFEIYNA